MTIGIQRLTQDLQVLGYTNVITQIGTDQTKYAIIKDFTIPAGQHKDKIIDLGIPAPEHYPRQIAASIHIKSTPQLYPDGNVPNVINVIASPLGPEWRYLSFRFHIRAENPTNELLTQINEIFRTH